MKIRTTNAARSDLDDAVIGVLNGRTWNVLDADLVGAIVMQRCVLLARVVRATVRLRPFIVSDIFRDVLCL